MDVVEIVVEDQRAAVVTDENYCVCKENATLNLFLWLVEKLDFFKWNTMYIIIFWDGAFCVLQIYFST